MLEVMSSQKLHEKQIGYLGASMSFTPETDVRVLVTNLMQKVRCRIEGHGRAKGRRSRALAPLSVLRICIQKTRWKCRSLSMACLI